MSTPPNSLGLIALEPVPTTHSAGVTLYRPVTDEKEILSHPEWPVYTSVEQAISRLNRAVHAPANCSRVFNSHDLSFRVANILGLQQRKWRSRADVIVVTSTPFLVSPPSPADLHALLSTRYSSIPVFGLSDTDLDTFVARNPQFQVRQTTGTFGCPSIGLRRLTKDGRPVRSPSEALARKKKNWDLLFNHPDLTRSFFNTFCESLIKDDPSSNNTTYYSRATLYRHFVINTFNSTCFLPGTRREPKTWEEHALTLSENLWQLQRFLNEILTHKPPYSRNSGNLRTPITYFFHRARHRASNALSLFYPYLPYLRVVHVKDPYNKLCRSSLSCITDRNNELALTLLRFSRALGFRTYPNQPTAHLFSPQE